MQQQTARPSKVSSMGIVLSKTGPCRATIKVRLSVNQGETAPCAV